MTRRFAVFVMAIVLMAAAVVSAQVATGTPKFGSFTGGPDVINLGNLNVHFSIPVLHKQGRGQPFDYNITSDSSVWYQTSVSGQQYWQPISMWGWQGVTPSLAALSGTVTYTMNYSSGRCGQYNQPYQSWYFTNFVYHDTNNNSISFPQGGYYYDSNGGLGCPRSGADPYAPWSANVNGYRMGVTPWAGGASSTVTAATGATLIPNPQDTNGNQITANSSTGQFFDTLSSTTPVLTISGAGTQSSPVVLSYTPPDHGDHGKYTVNYTNRDIKTNFACSGIHEYTGLATPLVSSIVLPEGTSYQFTYEQTIGIQGGPYFTGRIQSITLPTGGTINYTYTDSNGTTGDALTPAHNPINCSDGTALGFERVTPDSVTATRYTRSGSGTLWTTTVADPLNQSTTINFQQAGNNFYETKRQTSLNTVDTCYNTNTTQSSCTTATIALPILQTHTWTTLDSKVSRRDVVYDSNGLVTELDEYDFGSSAEGALLRKTTTNYAFYDRPAAIYVYDGQGNLKAQTTYGYDESTPQQTSGTPQHVAPSGARGNLTSIHLWTGSTTLNQTFTYFDTGNLKSATNVNDSTTNYEYNSSGCANSLPTKVTLPTVNGVTLTTQSNWDCTGGVITSTTDANNRVTSTSYTDPYFWRPASISYPDGGYTGISYFLNQSTPWISQDDQIDATPRYMRTNTYFDSLGRPIRTEQPFDADGTVYQTTTYNSLGQVWKVSNPYRSLSDSTYGITEYAYDALGRIKQVTRPDSNTVLYDYSGAAVSVQDEGNGTRRVQKIYQTDAAGRVKSVCEVTSLTLLGLGATPVPCQLDYSGNTNGFLTTYEYDALDNITGVTQGGLNGRIMNYDAFSRLTSETVPEISNSTITYSYDTVTKGDLYQRIRPAANQTNPAVTTTTTYSYDSLHRLTQVQYSDGTTPQVNYYYDEATVGGITLQNPKARMTHMSVAGNVAADIFSYDVMGRTISDWQCTAYNCGTGTWQLTRSFDLLGNIMSYTNGQGISFTLNYDGTPRLASMTSNWSDSQHPGTLISGLHYNALGVLTAGTLGNGVALGRSYNSRGFLTSATDGTVWSATNLNYKPNGNLSSANDSQNGNWSYTYDDFNRLGSAAITGNTYSYLYDRYGNRWQQNATGGGYQPQYAFDANNHITSSGIIYDAAGNVTNDSSHTYTYDAESRLVKVDGGATATYVYDAKGRRVRTVTSAGTKDFLFDLDGRAFTTIVNGGWARGEIMSPVGYLATYVNSTTYFNHTDWVGTVRARSNVLGGKVEGLSNLPFGDGQTTSGISPIQFTGLEFDSESGLTHAWFRQYSATQGRWMSSDPGGLAVVDLYNPQELEPVCLCSKQPSEYD